VLSEHLAAEPHTRLRHFCSPHHQDSALYPFIVQLERADFRVHRGRRIDVDCAKSRCGAVPRISPGPRHFGSGAPRKLIKRLVAFWIGSLEVVNGFLTLHVHKG
jgi:hypothetical protein